MDIIVRVPGRVEVEDVADDLVVQPARRDVRGDEDVDVAALESPAPGAQALRLFMSPWISPERKPCCLSDLFSSRTVVLRLQKMIAVRTSSCPSRWRRRLRFSNDWGATGTTNWVMLMLVERDARPQSSWDFPGTCRPAS